MRPRAIDVKPLPNYELLITFSNNEKKIFDVKPYMNFKPFEELKNLTLFNSVKIDGLSITWANNSDICPDELYNNSKPAE